MPRARGEKAYSPMTQGLITEASPLNAPEGSTFDELNFLLETDGGIRKRRKGFTNANSDFTKTVTGATGSRLLETFYWAEHSLYVAIISFSGANETWLRVHSNDSSFTYLGEFQIASLELTTISVDEVRGELIITGSDGTDSISPILVEKVDTTITFYTIGIYIRDFELVDDGLEIGERPTTLSDEHEYNLYNAGWYATRRLESNRNDTSGDPVTDFFNDNFNSTNEYPSNADIALLGISTDGDGNETFQKKTLVQVAIGSTEAPRGHYVYPLNDFDRNTKLTNKESDGTVSNSLTSIGSITV
jgi:hypothetical protein